MTTEQDSPQQETPQQEIADPQRPSVKTFRPAAFELCQFEVLSQGVSLSDFSATEFVCIEKTLQVSDPMFEVFEDIDVSPEAGTAGVV